jgi:hypothetical protein
MHEWRRVGRAPGASAARTGDGRGAVSHGWASGLFRRGAGGAQGEHLAEPLECVFTNGSLSLAVRAAVTGAGGATCVAPAWPLDRSGARPLQALQRVRAASCGGRGRAG